MEPVHYTPPAPVHFMGEDVQTMHVGTQEMEDCWHGHHVLGFCVCKCHCFLIVACTSAKFLRVYQ